MKKKQSLNTWKKEAKKEYSNTMRIKYGKSTSRGDVQLATMGKFKSVLASLNEPKKGLDPHSLEYQLLTYGTNEEKEAVRQSLKIS